MISSRFSTDVLLYCAILKFTTSTRLEWWNFAKHPLAKMQSLVDFRIGRKRVIRSARDAESIRSGSRIFEILRCRCARQTVALLIFVVVLSPSVINETKHKKQLANRFRNRTVTPTGPNRKQPVTVGVTPQRGRKKKETKTSPRGVSIMNGKLKYAFRRLLRQLKACT